jgi:hypothetical protein
MLRPLFGLSMLVLIGGGPPASKPVRLAWPHGATLTSLNGRPAAFRAYTLGGVLITVVDASGQRTTTPAAVPSVRALTAKDTIRAQTPANFSLDLSKGAVVFVAEGRDSLQIVVDAVSGSDDVRRANLLGLGRNPSGSIDRVRATGRVFTVRLVADRFVIDRR